MFCLVELEIVFRIMFVLVVWSWFLCDNCVINVIEILNDLKFDGFRLKFKGEEDNCLLLVFIGVIFRIFFRLNGIRCKILKI